MAAVHLNGHRLRLNSWFTTEKHYQTTQLNLSLGLICLSMGRGNQKLQQCLCELNRLVCVTGPSYSVMLDLKTMEKWDSTQHQSAAVDPVVSAESQKHLLISYVFAAVGWLKLLWNHSRAHNQLTPFNQYLHRTCCQAGCCIVGLLCLNIWVDIVAFARPCSLNGGG